MQVKRVTLQDISPTEQSAIDFLISDSFFASKGFMDLWASMSGTPIYWLVEENDEIVAVLPAVEFGVHTLKRMQAMPDGCYGSICFKKNSKIENYRNELLQAVLSCGYQKIFIYDYYDCMHKTELFEVLKCQTTLVDVSKDSWQPPDKKLQSEIRKAERENVQVEKFDKQNHFESFMKLMTQTEKRHNRKPKYSESFFLALAELAERDDRIIWNWCQHEGKAVSSHINFIEQNQILNWQVYFDKQFSFLKANQFMLSQLSKIAHEKKIQYLNLGASPIESQSLVEYKNKWGGETKEYTCYYHKSILGKLF